MTLHAMKDLSVDESPKKLAKVTGALLLVSIVAGSIGEFYVPSQLIVSGNASATAANFRANEMFFRFGFFTYLIEAVCDVSLSLCFYLLLRPVGRALALLSAFFGLVSTITFACCQIFLFMVLHLVSGAGYLNTFSPEQLDTLALLLIRFAGIGSGTMLTFYAIASLIRGYLIFRSGYLPKFLGVFLMIGGAGFLMRTLTIVLSPKYSSPFMLPAMIIAMVTLGIWLLAKGVDQAKWSEKIKQAPGIQGLPRL